MSLTSENAWAYFNPKQAAPKNDISKSPRLLFRTTFGDGEDGAGYEILLCDGSRVWREALTNEQIQARARDIHCAIEPTDPENRQALFGLIRQSFSNSDRQASNVKLDFSAKSGEQEFVLRLSSPLTPPLPDLKWVVYLKLLPSSAISTYLLDPLLLYASEVRAQVDMLVAELAAKDHVLERVCDRLEASGDSLTAVFPAKAGLRMNRNKSQRLQLGPHVPGLGTFDVAAWPERWRKAMHESEADCSARQAEVLKSLPATSRIETIEKVDSWWDHLPSANSIADDLKSNSHSTSHRRHVDLASANRGQASSSSEGACLQRQDLVQPQEAGDSTDDEDDSGVSALPARLREVTEQQSKAPVKKLGAIGGRTRTSAAPTAVDPIDETSETALSNVKHGQAARQKRLGTLGGRKKFPEPITTGRNEESATPSASEPPSPPAKKAKLGTIGGRAKKTAPAATPEIAARESPRHDIEASNSETSDVKPALIQDEHTRGRQASEAPNVRTREETSRERADRKREELKKELGDGHGVGSKNGGAMKKKKRKF